MKESTQNPNPPEYPLDNVTVEQLLGCLHNLSGWANDQRIFLNHQAKRDVIPFLADIDAERYRQLPIVEYVRHLQVLRAIRESWDYLRRQWGRHWDTEPSRRLQISVVQTAVELISTCCSPRESGITGPYERGLLAITLICEGHAEGLPHVIK